ncbi:MAG: DUF1592 domain-containing protein [Planctomycetota bacterium]|nr:DUF1592 domain-containing protein [Planctomycetota bacterium]
MIDLLSWDSMFRRITTALVAGFGFTAALPAQEATLRTTVQPFVKKWCAGCHSGDDPEADLDLVARLAKPPRGNDLALLLDIRDALRDKDMPPEDEPQPPIAQVKEILAWADRMLTRGKATVDPGQVTMRRLSGAEYRNTVRDLLGIDMAEVKAATVDFPIDDLGYGFDNNGDSLTVSPLHIENYATAAEKLAKRAVVVTDPNDPLHRSFELEEHIGDSGARDQDGGAFFSTERTVSVPISLPHTGLYRIKMRAYSHHGGDETAEIGFKVDRETKAVFEVANSSDVPGEFFEILHLPAGKSTLGVAFRNDFYDAKASKRGDANADRNLWVDYLHVLGPLNKVTMPASHQRIFAKDPGKGAPRTRARPILRDLMRRAWRRPPRRAELARTCGLVQKVVDNGGNFQAGIQLALQAVMVSPNFLFRIEPDSTSSKPADGPELLGHFEMATRLSYFLWSSSPDDRLLKLAAEQRLQDLDTLRLEVIRMLRDPRSNALSQNFAVQWLELRNLESVSPDPKRFPTWSKQLGDSMRKESELFFQTILEEGRDILELLDADFTVLDETLAKHYGIPGVKGPEFRKVQLRNHRRGGLPTQASIQTVTSNPTRTSPVKRGKWLLENILDDPPPPPPPGQDSFAEKLDMTIAHNLRQQMEQHRQKTLCASCHQRMDALGLAMQNYDAIGRWRDKDHGRKIDASGKLPGGRRVDGAIELKRVLADGHDFKRCLFKKLFLYALGRNVRGADQVVIDAEVRKLPKKATLTDMIQAIVVLDAFRRRTTQ